MNHSPSEAVNSPEAAIGRLVLYPAHEARRGEGATVLLQHSAYNDRC